ncbi:MAG: hypothetical protein HY000_08950 [Planctomycetes bacterium]|nr:hypothetical protein [Planctomycetota bacterium]
MAVAAMGLALNSPGTPAKLVGPMEVTYVLEPSQNLFRGQVLANKFLGSKTC